MADARTCDVATPLPPLASVSWSAVQSQLLGKIAAF